MSRITSGSSFSAPGTPARQPGRGNERQHDHVPEPEDANPQNRQREEDLSHLCGTPPRSCAIHAIESRSGKTGQPGQTLMSILSINRVFPIRTARRATASTPEPRLSRGARLWASRPRHNRAWRAARILSFRQESVEPGRPAFAGGHRLVRVFSARKRTVAAFRSPGFK